MFFFVVVLANFVTIMASLSEPYISKIKSVKHNVYLLSAAAEAWYWVGSYPGCW